MKKQMWVDTTSHFRGETSKNTTPRSWALGTGHLSRIVVHRHMSDKEAWFLSCYALKIEQHQLRAVELEAAKAEALVFVAKQLKDTVAYYKKLGIEI